MILYSSWNKTCARYQSEVSMSSYLSHILFLLGVIAESHGPETLALGDMSKPHYCDYCQYHYY
jgi:hypothetical protein